MLRTTTTLALFALLLTPGCGDDTPDPEPDTAESSPEPTKPTPRPRQPVGACETDADCGGGDWRCTLDSEGVADCILRR